MSQIRPSYRPPRPKKPSIWIGLLGLFAAFLVLLFQALRFSWRWYRRQSRRTQVIVAGVLVLLLLIGGVGSAISTTSPPTSQSNAGATPVPTHAQVVQVPPTDTPVQKVVLSPRPMSKPTAKPSPVASRPTSIPTLSITFTLVDAGDVAVHTLPGAALTIKVLYCSGRYATSQSLQGTFYADRGGDYIWTWTVETTCHGTATATVTASSSGKTVTSQAHFTT